MDGIEKARAIIAAQIAPVDDGDVLMPLKAAFIAACELSRSRTERTVNRVLLQKGRI